MRAGFSGQLWTYDHAAADDFGLNRVLVRHAPGLCTEHGIVNSGGNNGGMQAVNLAWHLGADRIVLLGYDMQGTPGRMHFHGDHSGSLGNPDAGLLRKWAQAAAAVAADLVDLGVDIINCSRQTAAQGWPKRELEDVINA